MSPPVDRSITVSAPYFTAYRSFSSSSAMSELVDELPMFALILHLDAMPIHIGSSEWWLMFAGMIMPPARYFVSDQCGRQVLAPCDVLHLASDLALAGVMNLGANRIVLALGQPLGTVHVPIIGPHRPGAPSVAGYSAFTGTAAGVSTFFSCWSRIAFKATALSGPL